MDQARAGQYRLLVQTFDDVARLTAALDEVTAEDLREALLDGWLAMAPPHLAEAFLGTLPAAPGPRRTRAHVLCCPNNEIDLLII